MFLLSMINLLGLILLQQKVQENTKRLEHHERELNGNRTSQGPTDTR